MYTPSHFAETRVDVLHEMMRSHSLATVVVNTAEGLVANHIPLVLDPEPTPYGTLRGHIARANPLWKQVAAQTQALVIFQGPDTYITPSWYPTKQETGKAVPTWNYVVVHAHGPLRIIADDPTWLREQLTQLTAQHEASRPQPWQMTDAPAAFIDGMLAAVVGIEIRIDRLEGKWKTSQNQTERNRAGVTEGLAERQEPHDAAMAALVVQAK